MSTKQTDGILRGPKGELTNLGVVGPEDAVGSEAAAKYGEVDEPLAGIGVVDALIEAKRHQDAIRLSRSA